MPAARIPEAAARAAHALVEQHGSVWAAANASKQPPATVQRRYMVALTVHEMPDVRSSRKSLAAMGRPDYAERRAAEKGELGGPPIPPIAVPPEGFRITRNAGAYDGDGKLLRQWVGTQRDAGDAYAMPDGHILKGESALVDSNGQVLAKWIKTREDRGGPALMEALEATFSKYTGAAPAIARPTTAEADMLTVYPVPDLHLGLYSWGRETGEDYDISIAVDAARRAIGHLVEESRRSRHAVVLGLGDYFHSNDARAATPRSNHQLDVDGRWPKVYEAGATLATEMIEVVASKHDDVEVVFLPGNHDPDAAVTLTVALAMFYAKHKRVRVHKEPGLVWYRRFGKCLLGATHGHTMKPDKMAMMLAADRPEDWGRSEHRHFFFGHVHHRSAMEIGAVEVESFTSPAAKDAFAAGGGWRSKRSLSAVAFHKDDGEVARHRVSIQAGKPRVRVRAR